MCYKKGVQKSKRMVCVVLGAALLWSGCNPLMVLEYGSRAVGTMVENLVSAYRAERDLFEGYIRELAGVKPVPAGHTLEEVTLQNPELPNGCEVTSLSMLLAAFGLPIDKVELYERYMWSCMSAICSRRALQIPSWGICAMAPLQRRSMWGMPQAPAEGGTALKVRL